MYQSRLEDLSENVAKTTAKAVAIRKAIISVEQILAYLQTDHIVGISKIEIYPINKKNYQLNPVQLSLSSEIKTALPDAKETFDKLTEAVKHTFIGLYENYRTELIKEFNSLKIK
jgi:hypothetical protein